MSFPHLFRTEHSITKTTNYVYGSFCESMRSNKIFIGPDLLAILRYVDLNREIFLKNLEDVIKIKSISNNTNYKNDLTEMIKYAEGWLIKLGLKYECYHLNHDGKELAPVILAFLGKKKNKKRTVCVYAHLDVKKPNPSQWETDPWNLTIIDNKLYGNGICTGKSTLLCWFHLIEAFQNTNTEFPVNLKFVVESMHHHNSEGLAEFLAVHREKFFGNVDNIVVCDSEWIGNKHPCIVHGTVGNLYFNLTIEKMANSKTEIEDDMRNILKQVVDEEENILIPNFSDFVLPITPTEERALEGVTDFDMDEIKESLPSFKQNWSQLRLLMHYWRLPSIWVSEIEKCTCDKKDTSKIKTRFIVKIVPRQIVDKTINLITKHIYKVVKDLDIENKIGVELVSATRPWLENTNSRAYVAAKRATIQIYKVNPNMIREDGSRLLITILETVLEKTILLLPFATKTSNVNANNENIPRKNWFEGTKVLAAYLFQIAELK